MELISEIDLFNLNIGDHVYDSRNRKVQVIDKNPAAVKVALYSGHGNLQHLLYRNEQFVKTFTLFKGEKSKKDEKIKSNNINQESSDPIEDLDFRTIWSGL